MKVLVVNGSPKGDRSNTKRLSDAFVEGMECAETRHFDANGISPCKGCFVCWNRTPGKCVVDDRASEFIESLLWADVVIWSFPLYYYSVPGPMKTLIDRMLPMSLPFMTDSDGAGSGSHPSRYDLSAKRHVLISTCGFYSVEGNYDSVTEMFDHILGKGRYETIFCGQGELFRVKELSARTDEYLEHVKDAGREFASGRISDDTRSALRELLYPKETFEKMADASWGISDKGEKLDETLSFTRQMAALYNPESFKGKTRVLRMNYTDTGRSYLLVLGKDSCDVVEDDGTDADTVINTPFSVWQSISRGEISGEQALGEGRYNVKGDFGLMMNWNEIFGTGSKAKEEKPRNNGNRWLHVSDKKPLMIATLLPFIVYWIAVPIDQTVGAIVSLSACAVMPLILIRHEAAIYDILSVSLVTVFALLSLLRTENIILIPASYTVCGAMWLLSCATPIPLCARYVMYDYYGEGSLDNPLFMKTNYILAALWGVTFIVEAAVVFAVSGTDLAPYSGLLGNILTIFMGVFTVWFPRWYPAKLARGHD